MMEKAIVSIGAKTHKMSAPGKIFIITFPAIGAVNVVLSLAHELVKNRNYKVVIYTLAECKEEIEKTGSECRSYDGLRHTDVKIVAKSNKRTMPVGIVFNALNTLVDMNTERLIRDIDTDKPDLILYDSMAFFARWILDCINRNYRNAESLRELDDSNIIIPTSPAPPAMVYVTSFPLQAGVYPNEYEQRISRNFNLLEKIKIIFETLKSVRKIKRTCKRLGLTYESPLKLMFQNDPDLVTLSFIFPELQPRYHLYKSNVKFVGPCIDENIHLKGFDKSKSDEAVKKLLEKYPIKNPSENFEQDYKTVPKLIYVSFGTVLNEHIPLYLRVLKALETFDEDIDEKSQHAEYLKFENLNFIVSMGARCVEGIKTVQTLGHISLSDNVLLVSSAPQIEILKRCSLFITHCGMNSVSEAIHYGVPMLALPIMYDQPLIAHRVTTELGLGIGLDFINLQVQDIRRAIRTLLIEKSYHERCIKYSKISRQYDGKVNATNRIVKFIKTNRQQQQHQHHDQEQLAYHQQQQQKPKQ